jgi:D-alanyl-D-alanine endopeptidase (penicillin-binding protein 7)
MSVIRSSIIAAAIAAFSFASAAHAASDSKHAVADFKSCAKPHYPAASLEAKHEGTVDLAFLVDTSGAVHEAKINKSSGHEPLDIAARDAIKLCNFKPAVKNGKAVKEWANVQYVWTLK